MNKILILMFFASSLHSCSRTKSAVSGKRVTVARGNISFVLPDSSLIYGKLILWSADFNGGEYGEAGAFYHNRDSTTSISVYVKAYPITFQGRLPWRIIADEQEARQMLLAKNHGLAIIEDFKADSLTRTTVISYLLVNQQERGWRGQLRYNKSITIYGRHRIISFWLFGPDSPITRQRFAAAQASIRVAPAYLQGTVAAYQSKAFQD